MTGTTMAENERDTIIGRIRKLLAYRDHGGEDMTEGELQNALDAARRLMAKHDVTEHEVLLSGKAAVETCPVVDRAGKLRPWETQLAWTCCAMFHVSAVIQQVNPAVSRLKFVGVGRDAAVAAGSWTELCSTLRVLARKRMGRAGRHRDEYMWGVRHASARARGGAPARRGRRHRRTDRPHQGRTDQGVHGERRRGQDAQDQDHVRCRRSRRAGR
jgi:hypothetical protein